MGEEKKAEDAKKSEESNKAEEAKVVVEEKKPEESKEGEAAAAPTPPPPPPPQEIILKVYMHCEACARKVRRCLQGFEGVEDVITDCRTSKVVVKGEKADPLKVLARVQRKSHRQVELISPIPPPPPPEEPKKEEKEVVKEEKEEEPPKITVVLRVFMHCEACSQEIRKRIQRMKGVESAEPDLKISQVTVKGVFEPDNLVSQVYKRTGKQATIVKVEVEKKAEEAAKDGKKPEEGEKEAKKSGEGGKENKDSPADGGAAATGPPQESAKPDGEAAEDPKMEVKRNEFYYYPAHQNFQVYPQRVVQQQDMYAYPPHMFNDPPQMFSDENPNACSVM